jgi:hypothetical protein
VARECYQRGTTNPMSGTAAKNRASARQNDAPVPKIANQAQYRNKKYFYISFLVGGGEGGIRTLGSSGFVIIGIRWCLEVLIS